MIHKKTTINLTDLSLDILPVNEEYPSRSLSKPISVRTSTADITKQSVTCYECKQNIDMLASNRNVNQSRANHYMQNTGETFMCSICPFIAPTECALMAHTRLHLKQTPLLCPECGLYETRKHMMQSKIHLCKGFKMIQEAARVQCILGGCTGISHPEQIVDHIQQDHLRPIFNCPLCHTAFGQSSLLDMHLKNEHNDLSTKVSAIYLCELCNKGLQEIDVRVHFKTHSFKEMYQCWICEDIFNDIITLYQHCIALCSNDRNKLNNNMVSLMNKCRQCNNTYIKKKSCPFKCVESKFFHNLPQLKNVRVPRVKCPLCKRRIKDNWHDLKNHFKIFHKGHTCVDVSVNLKRINIDKFANKVNKLIPNAENITKEKEVELNVSNTGDTIGYTCFHCNKKYVSKECLEKHLVSHRDPLADYQCLECGTYFSEKLVFMAHLLKEHNVNDVDVYIKVKKYSNRQVLNKNNENNIVTVDNQCKICFEEYDNEEDYRNHFRAHGVAFFMTK